MSSPVDSKMLSPTNLGAPGDSSPLQVYIGMQQYPEPDYQQTPIQRVARCSACELSTLINPSGPSTCVSCLRGSRAQLQSTPNTPISDLNIKRSRAGRNSKLPLAALNKLQAWLDAHQENPYPSAEEKRQLATECGITEKQVTTWFTNARARQLSPLDTWLSSASEEEGATESAIASAAETSPGFTYLSSNWSSTAGGASATRRAGSISGSSAFSAPGVARPQPSRRGKKKNYRRTNAAAQNTLQSFVSPNQSPIDTIEPPSGDQEMWQCTFCYRHLVPKSWRRHEETQHRPRAHWTCMLTGPRLSIPQRTDANPAASASGGNNPSSTRTSGSKTYCAFCMTPDPSEAHFHTSHRISECAKRPLIERTFYRPDHLRQHIRNFHGATLYDVVQARWKRSPDEVERKKGETGVDEGWVCGFCGEGLRTWSVRETHIAGHFKDGMTMASWKEWPRQNQSGNTGGVRVTETVTVEEHQQGKGKGKGKEKADGTLKRLSRTLTRRSMRGVEKTASTQGSVLQHGHQQEQPPPQQHHPQQHAQHSHLQFQQPHDTSAFSNTFQQIPINMAHNNTHQDHSAYCTNTSVTSAPPVLPEINMEPLMAGTYDQFVDWNQMCSTTAPANPQYTDPTMVFYPQGNDFDSTYMFGGQGYHGQQWGQGP